MKKVEYFYWQYFIFPSFLPTGLRKYGSGILFLGLFVPIVLFFCSERSVIGTESASANYSSEAVLDKIFTSDYLDIPSFYFGKTIFTGTDLKAPSVVKGVFSCPFGTERQKERFYFDEKVNLDLSDSNFFYLTVQFDDPASARAPSLYFHSGKGWYSMSGRCSKKLDGKTVRCEYNIVGASLEDEPGGLDKVDTIRIGFWRTANVDFKVTIGTFCGGPAPKIAVLQTSSSAEGTTYVKQMSKHLETAGFSSVKIFQERLTPELLKEYKAVVVPIGAGLTEKTSELLCDYLDQGGFIAAFYISNDRLLRKMGFTGAKYVQCPRDGVDVARIVFTPGFRRFFAPYMPNEMEQASFNFTWAVPIENPTDPYFKQRANAPRIAGWWHDSKGKKTQYPAVLWSGRGIYFSHVILMDDVQNKIKFLTAILDQFDLKRNPMAFCRKWQQLFDIGLPPKTDLLQSYKIRGQEILSLLNKKGWSASDLMKMFANLEEAEKTSVDVKQISVVHKNVSRLSDLLDAMESVRGELIHKYLQKMEPMAKETRFWWEHSGTGPYPGDWDRTMKELSASGYNGVVCNMAWGGLAHYDSQHLPKSNSVTKYGDQIAQMVAAGKKYGVETHIWKVNFNTGGAPKEFIEQMDREGRSQRDFKGERGTRCWLCPSHPANQDLEVAVMLEIAKKYEVDGIHFDYIRYPDQEHCYCDGCRDRFSKYYQEKTGKHLSNWPQSVRNDPAVEPLFIQWRCDQVTNVVRRVREGVNKLDRKVLVSAAVFSGWPGTRKSIGQDWADWCKKGYLDFVFPMNYTDQIEDFEGLVARQQDAIGNACPIYPGIGATVPSRLSPDKVAAQIQITRQKKTGGFCLFDLSKQTIKSIVPANEGTPFAKKSVPSHRK